MPNECETCKANKVCDHNEYGFENCGNYIPADVVEVVRCKDCKFAEENGGDCNGTLPITYRNYVCEINETKYIKLDFCSYGERKPKETVSLVDGHIDNSNRCVSCGAEIPEGTWTCPSCDRRWG